MKKKEDIDIQYITTEELLPRFKKRTSIWNAKTVVAAFMLAFVLCATGINSINRIRLADEIEGTDMALALNPIAATNVKRDLISIPSGTVKANPFLPYRNIGAESVTKNIVDDVPKFDLIDPPDEAGAGSDAVRVMDTVVSGILYDKHSPSAILNIEGNDYLVKNGDVVNNYKVIAIAQDSVTVKLGSNTYKAGIGEILTEGEVNHNDVSNLSKKFGGERR